MGLGNAISSVDGLQAKPIRAVAFDAVGTLIYAMPSVSDIYCRLLGQLSGQAVDAERVQSVLSQRLSERSIDVDLRTSEVCEREFWFELVAELVPDRNRRLVCFDALYRHFAESAHWRCYDDVEACFASLRAQNLQIVMASNFDERLHTVCAGLHELKSVSNCIVSSEVGWRKPALQFFDIVCQRTQCAPEEILFVGDDPLNDIQGAIAAGMSAAWIDRRGGPLGAVDATVPPPVSAVVLRVDSLQSLAHWLT